MFTSSIFRPTAKVARFIAVAGLLAAVAVPVGLSLGTDGPAYAQSAGGKGRGGGGGGNGSGSTGGGGNSALKCIGPDCLDITAANPNCGPGAITCVPPKIVEKRPFRDSCEVQVCDVVYGERVCWLERAYDVRICKKERL